MKKNQLVKIAALSIGFWVANHMLTKYRAFEYAKSLAREKGIINLGSSGSIDPLSDRISNDPLVYLNVDIVEKEEQPQFYQHDLNQPLTFNSGLYDVAFASHILEHLDNWQTAFSEFRRIADNVVIVLPSPLSLGNYLNPLHKRVFSSSQIAEMESNPNVKVFTNLWD